jgi:hypothetical protein
LFFDTDIYEDEANLLQFNLERLARNAAQRMIIDTHVAASARGPLAEVLLSFGFTARLEISKEACSLGYLARLF